MGNRETGEVSCNFENNNACPAASTLPLMGIYRNNNNLWLDDFKAVLEKMLVHGYSIDSDCGSLPCVTLVGEGSSDQNNDEIINNDQNNDEVNFGDDDDGCRSKMSSVLQTVLWPFS